MYITLSPQKPPYKEEKKVPLGTFEMMVTLQVKVLVSWGVRAKIQVYTHTHKHTHIHIIYLSIYFNYGKFLILLLVNRMY